MKCRSPLFLSVASTVALAASPQGAQPPAAVTRAMLASAPRAAAAAAPGAAVDPPAASRTRLDAVLVDLRALAPSLASLVTAMNEARGPTEADAVAAVVDDLVARRVGAAPHQA